MRSATGLASHGCNVVEVGRGLGRHGAVTRWRDDHRRSGIVLEVAGLSLYSRPRGSGLDS